MEQEAGPSNIFQSLTGNGLTEEQWESYKELKLVESGLVCSDSDEECEEGDVDSRSSSPFQYSGSSSPLTTLLPLTETGLSTMKLTDQMEGGESGGSDVSEDEPDGMTPQWETALTVKYINGELSFSEFADIMEHREEVPEIKEESSATKEKEFDKDAMEKAEKEYDEELKKKRKRGRRQTRLPRYLQGLMGEAHLCFARGDHEDAIKMCMEIIRSAPTAHEPFQTLGFLYEELGNMEKAFQFFLIGAYLHPNDAEEWIKLAEMSLEQGDTRQAINCYSNAIRCDPTNISLLWERCNLYEQQGDRKKALGGYEAIMQQLKPEQGEQCVQLSREIAKIHHESDDIPAAIQVMEVAFSKFPSLITSEDVNVLLELQINQKRYKDSVNSLYQHCGIYFLSEEETIISMEEINEEDGFSEIKKCIVPEVLPIDLQVKLCNSLIHLKALHIIEPLLIPLQQENPDDMGDLYLDIAEAFMDVGEYSRALPFLNVLLSTDNYNLAAVWLRQAECLNAAGNIELATAAYRKVVEMAPTHLGARLCLSSLLQQRGMTQEAISTLKQDYEKGKEDADIDLQLLVQRCTLLYAQSLWDEFIKAVKLIQGSHCSILATAIEYSAVLNNQSYRRRTEALREIRDVHGSVTGPKYTNKNVSPSEIWDLYKKCCHKLFELQRFLELQNLTLQSLTSPLFNKTPQKAKDSEFLALLACYFNRNHNYAYILIKELVIRELHNVRAWNLFCQVITMGQDIRHNKFCLRLMMKYQDHVPLAYLNGHNAMVAGSYKHALGEYMCVFKEHTSNPFTAFCVALTFVHMASQKFASKRHSLVLQGTVFLNQYVDLRGECQESLYNMGRAMHQLGLCDQAVFYYKKALAMKPAITGKEEGYFDLSHEIVYNLSLIYQNSGAPDLAQVYIQKYCIV